MNKKFFVFSSFLHVLLLFSFVSLSLDERLAPTSSWVDFELRNSSQGKTKPLLTIHGPPTHSVLAPVPVQSSSPTPSSAEKAEALATTDNKAAGNGLAGSNHESSRGPKIVYSPLPRMPEYLTSENLKTSVVIEFTIFADSSNQARLVDSSGNEELDALAMGAARRWKFQAALADNVPMDSVLRLRVNFIVD